MTYLTLNILGIDPKTRKEKVSRKALLPRPPRDENAPQREDRGPRDNNRGGGRDNNRGNSRDDRNSRDRAPREERRNDETPRDENKGDTPQES